MISTQWQIIKQDKWLLSCLTWIPIALALLIWGIFSQGIARELPIGVVDLQHSQLSRSLIRHYDASSSLSVAQQFDDVSQAKEAMISQDIYGYLVIPRNFDKGIYQALPPQVSLFFNSQFILVGRIINGAALQAQGTFNAQLGVAKGLVHGDTTLKQALGKAVTVRTQITPLFNSNTSYEQFLVSSIVPALWQIMIVVCTILILTANHRTYGLHKWLEHGVLTSIWRTLSSYIVLFMLFGVAFLSWFYLGFKWVFAGHWGVLLFAQLLTVIACMIMGAFFFFMTLDPARAMSFAGAFTAPSFAFMGITFPTSDMNMLAQMWRSLLPISHYIEAQVNQVSYGTSTVDSLVQLVPMTAYLIPLVLVLLFARKHLNQQGDEK